jgi:hypothetical protein
VIDNRFRLGHAVCILMLLSGCNQAGELKRLTPPEHDRLAREFLDAVRARDTVSILDRVTPSLQVPGSLDSLWAVASRLPGGPIDTLRQVGLNRVRTNSRYRTSLAYEIHTSAGWGLAVVNILEQGGQRSVEGFYTKPLPAAIETTNGFSLRGGNPVGFLVLLLALLCAGFTIVAAVIVVKERIPRRWLWALFALLGVAPVTVNWATGQVSFQLLSVALFSAGIISAGIGGPWLVSAAFPAGAIAAVHKVRSVRRARLLPKPEAGTIDTSPAS